MIANPGILRWIELSYRVILLSSKRRIKIARIRKPKCDFGMRLVRITQGAEIQMKIFNLTLSQGENNDLSRLSHYQISLQLQQFGLPAR
jgi:ribosomal protein S4E